MKSTKLRSSILLLITAFIWGTSFVAQSIGNQYIGPFTFNFCRFLLGGIVLLPVAAYTSRKQKAIIAGSETAPAAHPENQKKERMTLLLGGICCGLCLFLAGSFQQVGMIYTTVGKSGFITAMYIILVPILGIFLKRKCSSLVWISVFIALLGMYLLCINEGVSINKGDLLMCGSALMFACHILIIDHFAPKTNNIALSCIQFLVAGLLSIIPSFLTETPVLSEIYAARYSILYLGIFSSGIAYTLQIIAQKGLNPTIASLIMSLESAISAIAGWIILGEALSPREIAGCVIMFFAIILAQLPSPKRKKEAEMRSS